MTIFAELAPVAKELIDELELDVVVQERAVTQNPTAGTTSIGTTDRAACAALRDFEETFEDVDDRTGRGRGSRRKVTNGVVIVPAAYLPNGAEAGWSVFLAATSADPATEYKVVAAERRPKIGTPIAWLLKVRR